MKLHQKFRPDVMATSGAGEWTRDIPDRRGTPEALFWDTLREEYDSLKMQKGKSSPIYLSLCLSLNNDVNIHLNNLSTEIKQIIWLWWRHQMGTFSALLVLCAKFTGDRWIPRTKASDAELWCFLWSAPCINGWVNNREAGNLRRHCGHYDVIVMTNYDFLLQNVITLPVYLCLIWHLSLAVIAGTTKLVPYPGASPQS